MTIRRFVVLAAILRVALPASAQVWEVGNRAPEPRFWPTQSDYVAAGTRFGAAVAVGDIDGDGYLDLVVGQPGWDGPAASSGVLWLFKVTAGRSIAPWLTRTPTTTAGSQVGLRVVTGDFDGDDRDEIAYSGPGAPVMNLGLPFASGRVWVLDWLEAGWSETSLDRDLLGAEVESGDEFGDALAVADFNGDGFADLAVGAPGAGGSQDGAVHVFFGSLAGLRTDNPQTFAAGSGGIAAGYDQFASSLAGGDFDGDGYDELAIGTPLRDSAAGTACGEVHVLPGSSGGLTATGLQVLTLADFGGSEQSQAEFGAALAAGDFDSAGEACDSEPCQDDLAIGVPGRTAAGQAGAGVVLLAQGHAAGLQPQDGELSQADLTGQAPEPYDRFGRTLAAGKLHGWMPALERWDDLVVAAPLEDAAATDQGALHAFFGSAAGLGGGAAPQTIATAGLRVVVDHGVDASDRWAESLAIGDLDQDGWGDLVVGVPGKEAFGYAEMGAVQVIFGGLFTDGFERGATSAWSTALP